MDNRIVGTLMRRVLVGLMLNSIQRQSWVGTPCRRKHRRSGQMEGALTLSDCSSLRKRMRYARRKGFTEVTVFGYPCLPP